MFLFFNFQEKSSRPLAGVRAVGHPLCFYKLLPNPISFQSISIKTKQIREELF